jgi:cation:H+ antiporter
VVIGLALLVVGARWLVDGTVTLAGTLGLSDLIIGLTAVAVGTEAQSRRKRIAWSILIWRTV